MCGGHCAPEKSGWVASLGWGRAGVLFLLPLWGSRHNSSGVFIFKGNKDLITLHVHPKGGQSWVFFGRTDVEAETPIPWPPDAKSWLIWKDPDSGKDWGQEEKGTTEDEMVGWHQQLDGHGFGWTPGVGDGQGGLACCGSWGRKESDATEWLNWTEHGHEDKLR